MFFQGPQSDKEEELAGIETWVAKHAEIIVAEVQKVEKPKRTVTKPS